MAVPFIDQGRKGGATISVQRPIRAAALHPHSPETKSLHSITAAACYSIHNRLSCSTEQKEEKEGGNKPESIQNS